MPPALMMTPWIRVRFQYCRHQATSHCLGSRSVMLVCPQRSARRYQGRAGEDSGRAVCGRGDAALKSEARIAAVIVAAFFKKSRRDSRPAQLTDSQIMTLLFEPQTGSLC